MPIKCNAAAPSLGTAATALKTSPTKSAPSDGDNNPKRGGGASGNLRPSRWHFAVESPLKPNTTDTTEVRPGRWAYMALFFSNESETIQ